jgi:outer membrane lipoprotein-sorting protein
MRSAAAVAALAIVAFAAPANALSGPSAIADAHGAFAKVDDYKMTISVHETADTRVQDRTYDVMFKKPMLEKVDIVAGQDRGGGIVWLGGDKVKGHHGGLLSGIHLTFGIHDSQVLTLRGDSVDTATIPSMLDEFEKIKGTITQGAGPEIDGAATEAVTLDVTDPTTDNGVTRTVLYLSDATHLPVRRERFIGTQLVKSENVTDMKINVGLTQRDFPW